MDRMQGFQKIKCTNRGTMFISQTGTSTCPSCSEFGHVHTHESNSSMGGGGCGCGHSH
jgi:hypothetical protein